MIVHGRRSVTGRTVDVLAGRPAPAGFAGILWVDAGTDPARYAHDLYASLRRLDWVGAELILVEAVPASPAWDAVRDRLGRAAAACAADELA